MHNKIMYGVVQKSWPYSFLRSVCFNYGQEEISAEGQSSL